MPVIKIHYFSDDLPRLQKTGKGDWIDLYAAQTMQLRAGDFVPLDFELNFADPEQIAPITLSDGAVTLNMSGVADRVDGWLKDGKLYLRVVDYKTGAPHLEFAGVESLFRGEGKQRLSNILQTLLYAMMLYRTRGVDAEPALYYVRAMNRPDYLPTLDDRETGVRGGRYTLYAERFEELVRQTLAELYDPSVPFRQCEDADTCKFCDFNVICKR